MQRHFFFAVIKKGAWACVRINDRFLNDNLHVLNLEKKQLFFLHTGLHLLKSLWTSPPAEGKQNLAFPSLDNEEWPEVGSLSLR